MSVHFLDVPDDLLAEPLRITMACYACRRRRTGLELDPDKLTRSAPMGEAPTPTTPYRAAPGRRPMKENRT